MPHQDPAGYSAHVFHRSWDPSLHWGTPFGKNQASARI